VSPAQGDFALGRHWDVLDDVVPGDFTVHTAIERLGDADPWAAQLSEPQHHTIPVSRVQAMHEGKRRAREQQR
jgi:hypothetical protein